MLRSSVPGSVSSKHAIVCVADARSLHARAQGGAVLFYNLLPDGNADVKSLHAALPVVKGEKWLANFWVWDAKRFALD